MVFIEKYEFKVLSFRPPSRNLIIVSAILYTRDPGSLEVRKPYALRVSRHVARSPSADGSLATPRVKFGMTMPLDSGPRKESYDFPRGMLRRNDTETLR